MWALMLLLLLPQQQPDLRAEVVKLNEAMVEAFKTNPATVAAFYADDAKILGPGPSAEGREAIDRYWKMFPAGSFTWKLDVIDVGGNRNLVYQYGKSTLSNAMGPQIVDFVLTWKRQPNGQLKIVIDYWTPAR
ncbi:MAG TPA: nuclear transport factor 2 family protein [Longimicrobiales bacterium]|nr:nuclear transport factor 2 family protein [Longimicrobiales bacterium]